MYTKIPQTKPKIHYKHILLGIVILISGILIGFIGGAYMVGTHFDFFRPNPKDMVNKVACRIVEDFPALAPHQTEIESLIDNDMKCFGRLNDEVSYRILQLQHKIAINIAELMPNNTDKKRWMASFPQYFPGHKRRMPRAKRFEKRMEDGSPQMLEDWEHPDRHCPPPFPPPDND